MIEKSNLPLIRMQLDTSTRRDEGEDDYHRLYQISDREVVGGQRNACDPREAANSRHDNRTKVHLAIRPPDSLAHSRQDDEKLKREVFGKLEDTKKEIENAVRREFDHRLLQMQDRFESDRSSLEQQRDELEKKVANLRNIQVMMEDDFEKKEAAYVQTIARLNAIIYGQKSAAVDREPDSKTQSPEADERRDLSQGRSRYGRTDESRDWSDRDHQKEKSLPRQLLERVTQQPRRTNSRSLSHERTENSRCNNRVSIRELDNPHNDETELLEAEARIHLQSSMVGFDPFEIKQSSHMSDLARRIVNQRKAVLSQLQAESSQGFAEPSPRLQAGDIKRQPQSAGELKPRQAQLISPPIAGSPDARNRKRNMFFESDQKHKQEADPRKQATEPQKTPASLQSARPPLTKKSPPQQSSAAKSQRHAKSNSILPIGHILELILQADGKDDSKSRSMKQMKQLMAETSISDEALTPKVQSKLQALLYQKKASGASQKASAQLEYLDKLLTMLEELFREQFFPVQRRLEVLGQIEAADSLERRISKAKSWVDSLQLVQATHAPMLDLMRRREAVRVHIEQVALSFTDLRQLAEFNRESSSLYSLLRTINKQVFSYLHRHPATPRKPMPEYFGVAVLDLIASDFWEEEYLRKLEGRRQVTSKL